MAEGRSLGFIASPYRLSYGSRVEPREFHYTEGGARKFWAISTQGSVQTIVFGPLGTPGRVTTKRFATDEAAQAAAERLIRGKLRKGYVKVAASHGVKAATSSPATATTPQVAATASPGVGRTPGSQTLDWLPLGVIFARRLMPPGPPMVAVSVPDADPEELPDILVRPPWTRPPLAAPHVQMLEEAPPGSPAPSLLRRLGRLLGRVVGIGHPPPPSLGIDRPVAPDPLRVDPARVPPMPVFWDPCAWPRPLLAGREKALPLSAIENLGVMLALSTLERPYAGLAQVRAACDPTSLAAFGWALLRAWVEGGGPLKEAWPFSAMAHLADDEGTRRFARLLPEWPSIGWYKRALVGLDVLAHMRTLASLRELHRIGDKAKSRPLRARAQGWLKAVANSRGLTADTLADRLVPDLGLGPNGSRWLELEGRTVRVGFDDELRPYVKDETGQPLKDLPAASASASTEARAAWLAMKKEARAVLTEQTRRLERAMCAQRRWDPESFRQVFVEHPLLGRLARRLVWATFDGRDRVIETFRIAEDGTYADASDTRLVLQSRRVGIPHALELQPSLRDAWARLLADYVIVQPFPQVCRAVHAPVGDEPRRASLDRVFGVKVGHGPLLGLERRGWFKGEVEAGGAIRQFGRAVPDGAFYAELWFEPGLLVLRTKESGEQTLGLLYLWRTDGKPARFGEIGPITFSELVEDLESLRA